MSLARRLHGISDGFASQAPEAAAAIHRIIADLKASGVENQALGVGDVAPAFGLEATDGRVVTLDELVGSRPVILTFYRGRW
jgi:hypothetical protein